MPNSFYQNNMLALIEQRPFDMGRANALLAQVGDINQTIFDGNGWHTTFLYEAVGCNNLDAVRFLLEHGADPNYVSPDYDCAFGELQYGWEEKDEDRTRYEIAKLFFSHGADHNLLLEGETIFDYVSYKIYNEIGEPDWPFLVSFYKLLVLYGGGGHGYGTPEISEPIDFDRVDEYQIRLRQHEDGYHIEGFLLNPDGIIIGHL